MGNAQVSTHTSVTYTPKYLTVPNLNRSIWSIKKQSLGDLSGAPGAKTPRFQCRGRGSIPGQGTKIPYVTA